MSHDRHSTTGHAFEHNDSAPETLKCQGARRQLTPEQIETIQEALESDAEYWRTIADPADMDKVAKINAAAEAFRAMVEE